MENTALFEIILIVFGILNLILFFKLWGMTNDVRELKNHFLQDNSPISSDLSSAGIGWAENVTDQEKIDASKQLYKLEPGHVIAKVLSNKRMEVWSETFWNQEKENPNYKLIFRK